MSNALNAGFRRSIWGALGQQAALVIQIAIVAITVVIVDIIVMWLFFATAARSFQRFTRDARGQRILNRIFGVLFVAVGLLLVFIH